MQRLPRFQRRARLGQFSEHKTSPVVHLYLEQLESRLAPNADIVRSFPGLAFPDSGGFVPPDTPIACLPLKITWLTVLCRSPLPCTSNPYQM